MEPIERFLQRYYAAMRSNSKEIRLSISQATDLASAISTLLAENNMLYKKQEEADRDNIVADGGGFH